jgi:hypothetical protein
VAFVTLRGGAYLKVRRRPRAPKRVVSLGKICEGPLRLRKERSKSLVEWRKWLKERRLRVGLVSNSSFLNEDVGITGGDSELWQINSRVNCLVCLLVFFLSKLLE